MAYLLTYMSSQGFIDGIELVPSIFSDKCQGMLDLHITCLDW
jgi:hypothetical protein